MQKTIVVVPCYNEAERLPAESFLEAAGMDPSLTLLFVDDGSTDATRAVLAGLCSRRPKQLLLLGLDQNVGKAEAVRRGLLAALERSPALVGYFDADLATPLSEVAPMRALFDDPVVEMVLGSRVALLGRAIERSAKRHYLGRVFATVASLVLGIAVYDTQCGAKLFRNTPRTRALFARPFCVSWSFDVEILARLLGISSLSDGYHGGGVAIEYPLRGWRDVAGSKLGLQASLRATADLLVVWARYRRAPARGAPLRSREREPQTPHLTAAERRVMRAG